MNIPSGMYEHLVRGEGKVPHMYLDTVGIVTCGIGFALPDVKACVKLAWSPSSAAAEADWRLVKAMTPGKPASFYRSSTVAKLSEAAMREAVNRKLDEMLRQLGEWHLERHPESVRIAVLDMAYNLGVGGVNKFARLRAALDVKDYVKAAAECKRKGISDARNAETAALFVSAV